jgi:hypothetical protein
MDEKRFSTKIMDKDYQTICDEIQKKTRDSAEMDRLMHEYHNERIAELVRTKDIWLDKSDSWPITVNQFNQITAGNHRFRAVRFLGQDEVTVVQVTVETKNPAYNLPEIWE